MSVRIAIVCEARPDCAVATALIDGLLCQRAQWIEQLEDYRSFCGLEPSNDADQFLQWSQVKSVARQRGITFQGFFKNRMPASPDAYSAVKALLMLERSDEKPDAVVLLRDSDSDQSRFEGLRQAREEEPWKFRIAVGVAHTKRECWLIAAFDPEDSAEEELVERLRGDFPPGAGFDARLYSERLTAKQEGAKLDAKRVLSHLCRGNGDRENRCLANLLNDEVLSRASGNGLKAFVEEIVQRILPLFVHPTP